MAESRKEKREPMQEPSTGRKKSRSAGLWVVAAVAALGLALYAGLQLERTTVISEVSYQGLRFATGDEVDALFAPAVGLHPDSVRFITLIDSAKALPWIKEAGVRVEAGGRMVIDVEERTPLALLIQGSERAYVDEEGVRMPVRAGVSANVPLLHSFPATPMHERLEGEQFEYVRDFLKEVRQNDLAWITVSEVAWSQDEGVVALTQENGVKLLFGFGNYEEKLSHWRAFYNEVIREQGIGSFTSVDLRFRNQVVTRQG